MTYRDALNKAMKYCAYQERCQKEVRNKLFELGANYDEIEHIIAELVEQNFINEERFATCFARGKFYYKQWGKYKIRQELKTREISEYCIKKGLKEIDEQDYQNTLQKLIDKKSKEIGGIKIAKNKQKVALFLIGKGYESEDVWNKIKGEL